MIENVHEVKRVHETGYVRSVVLPAEIKLACFCETAEDSVDLVSGSDPFDAVPLIAVVPPTPDGKLQSLDLKESPDSNESGLCEEPPYKVFTSASLRRYGTMSSLEKVPSDERYDSSEDEDKNANETKSPVPNVDGEVEDKPGDNEDIQVTTKKVYSQTAEEVDDATNASLRNWTARAGSYMADKISFFEESRAFFDKYMGRWEKEANEDGTTAAGGVAGGADCAAEDCTSGATSGEDVWGTPSSGGENDEMQMFNSDQTQSVSVGISNAVHCHRNWNINCFWDCSSRPRRPRSGMMTPN